MDIILILFAIFGLGFAIREAEGPWGIIARWRNFMMRIPWLGVQFSKLISCYFCLGIWSAATIVLIRLYCGKLSGPIIWVLAGGTACLLIEAILHRLWKE